jgi:hypothetical protein
VFCERVRDGILDVQRAVECRHYAATVAVAGSHTRIMGSSLTSDLYVSVVPVWVLRPCDGPDLSQGVHIGRLKGRSKQDRGREVRISAETPAIL